jgi:nitrite reductase/ring-hydroxylating ferredoxin subunit
VSADRPKIVIELPDFDEPPQPPIRFFKVAHKTEIRPGRPHPIRVGLKKLILVNVANQFHALARSCPHAGGDLANGDLRGHFVNCKRHDWRFDVRDGHCPEHDIYQARTYPTEVREGWIWVGVPGEAA